MRSPLKPPSYNPCHPWDDFMRSRETMGNLHVPVLGWVWRMRTVCSNDSEQSLYHVRLLARFACVPNAESTNGMAHMQQSFFLSSEIATLCEASRLVVDSAAFASWYFDSARMAEPPTKWSWTGPRQSIQASRSCNSLCRWVNASVSSTGLLHVRLQWRHGSYFSLHGHVVQERWVAKCPHSKMPKLRHSCIVDFRSGFDRSRKQSGNILKQHRIMDVMVTVTLHPHVTKTTHWLEDVGSSRIQLVENALMAPHFLQTLVLYLPRHSHSRWWWNTRSNSTCLDLEVSNSATWRKDLDPMIPMQSDD